MTQTGAGTEVSLINVFLETKDWSVGVNLHFWLILALVLIPIAILLIKRFFGNPFNPDFELDEAEIGVGDQKFKFKPNYTDRQIAYAIWVELSTRKIGLDIDFDNDVIAEVYNSWYEFFSVTRELIKQVPVSKIQSKSTKAVINLSINVLNDGLRPHLTRWQARFRRWYERELKRYEESSDHNAIDLQEIQKSFPQYEELKADMEQVNKRLIAYKKKMNQLIYK